MDRGNRKTKENERASKEKAPKSSKRQKVNESQERPMASQEEEKHPQRSMEEEKEPKQQNKEITSFSSFEIPSVDMRIPPTQIPKMETADFIEDHADFGTFEPMLYQVEHDEDSEGEDDINEIEGEVPEGEDLEIEKLPEEGQRNIFQSFGSLGAPRAMQDSHPQIPQRFRAIQMSRAIRRMAERYSGGRGRGRGRNRRTDENSIKFDNLFAQLQTQNIDELKTNIALLNTEI